MKEIKILRLTLENFKCHAFLNLQLDGQSVSIYGDNATGKTSVYDALTWLLFGKDSTGNGEKNIDIKPLDANGEVKDHQAITSVEVEFLADGENVVFKRTFREVWATRRGSSTPVYEGNVSDYFVDGVPQKKNEYDRRIRELVSEDLFRMLTSVSYFASAMKWQDRRAVLFDMTGAMSDKEIMAMNANFAPLLESMGKLNLSEYKAKLASQKRGLTGVRDDAPTRINECQRNLQELEGIDFEEAKHSEMLLTAEQEELSAQLIALQSDTALESKRLEIRAAKLERDTLESHNRAHRDMQKAAGPDVGLLKSNLNGEEMRLQSLKTIIDSTRKGLERYDLEIQNTRAEWVKVNGEAFAGGACPTCGQSLPFEQLKSATADFEQAKRIRLAEIERKAASLKENRDNDVSRLAELEKEAAEREQRITSLKAEIQQAQSTAVVVSDLDGYGENIAALNAKISALQNEYNQIGQSSAAVRDGIRAKLNAVNDQLRFTRGVIAKEAIKDQTMKRIAELKADAKNAAEALESIEKMLYTIEEFTRFKAKFVEGSINDLFRIATFRLFREQANGGLEERCDVVYDGVPFMGLNNGMKVNVGIDIINALSRHYGVTVPLFVDNAEAVTHLEACGAQVIRLVVSENDKELRIA
jgi:DNA repair exonuclease SbcCD ATPase subunit